MTICTLSMVLSFEIASVKVKSKFVVKNYI